MAGMSGIPGGAVAGAGGAGGLLYEESAVLNLKEKVDALARALQGSAGRQGQDKKERGVELDLLWDGFDARKQTYGEPTLSKKQMLDTFEDARSKLEEVPPPAPPRFPTAGVPPPEPAAGEWALTRCAVRVCSLGEQAVVKASGHPQGGRGDRGGALRAGAGGSAP